MKQNYVLLFFESRLRCDWDNLPFLFNCKSTSVKGMAAISFANDSFFII